MTKVSRTTLPTFRSALFTASRSLTVDFPVRPQYWVIVAILYTGLAARSP